jgi:hypothetical protein
MWWLLSRPVFYRVMLAKMVILIEEAWVCNTRFSEEGPCKGGMGDKMPTSRQIWVV